MGLPYRRCANCQHFVHGSPQERDFWPTQHGHCYRLLSGERGSDPQPTHANSRGCKVFSEKDSTRLTAEVVDSGSKDSAPIDGNGERS
jgi:hypothetical protein